MKTKLELGKRPVRRWQRRWFLQPNVFDFSCGKKGGEIWIQKWVREEKFDADQGQIDSFKDGILEKIA